MRGRNPLSRKPHPCSARTRRRRRRRLLIILRRKLWAGRWVKWNIKYLILFYIKYCSQYRWKKRIHASKFGAIIKAHGKYQEDFISSKLSFWLTLMSQISISQISQRLRRTNIVEIMKKMPRENWSRSWVLRSELVWSVWILTTNTSSHFLMVWLAITRLSR